MKDLLRLSAIALLLMMSATACEKDDEDDNNSGGASTAQTKSEMLIGNDWVLVSHTTTEEYDCDDDGTIDQELVPDCYEECDLDDIWDFAADSTFTWSESTIACDGVSGEIYDEGTWSLNSQGTELTMNDGQATYTIMIQSLSATELKTVDTYTWQGETITEVMTYQ